MNKINKKKDEVQNRALKSWFDNSLRGSLILATGSGKTRIGVLAATKLIESGEVDSAYIVVPSQNLRDSEWVNEFEKWGFVGWRDKVKIECIQTAYRLGTEDQIQANPSLAPQGRVLLIVDEIHSTLSPEYRSLYNFSWTHVLGLTATLPHHNEEYLQLLEQVAPPLFTYTLQDGVEDGIIAPFQVYNIPVKFTRKERFKYRKFDEMFSGARRKLNAYISRNKLGINAFDLANLAQKDKNHPAYSIAKQFWSGMTMRKWVCYNAERKIDMCRQIIEKFPELKWITFSKSTKFTDILNETLNEQGINGVAYHSKMNTKDRADSLHRASDDSIRVINSAVALNVGYNLPTIDGGICASGTSVELSNVQQIGRTVRLKDDKRALFFNLYVENTQEQKWVESKTKNMETTWINSLSKVQY